jgi:hypothetical protein
MELEKFLSTASKNTAVSLNSDSYKVLSKDIEVFVSIATIMLIIMQGLDKVQQKVLSAIGTGYNDSLSRVTSAVQSKLSLLKAIRI